MKALTTLLVVGMFLTSVAAADDAHDVDSNTGKSGYLTGTFFLFQMNSNKQLLQWDSDLGQVISRKSPSDLPFTLKFSRQQPEPVQLGAAIVPVSSLSLGPSWYSFPTASMATFPLPQGTRHRRSPQRTYDLRMGVLGGALIGVGVYLMATSEKELHHDAFCFVCPPCTSEEVPGCFSSYDIKMPGGILSAGIGALLVVLAFF